MDLRQGHGGVLRAGRPDLHRRTEDQAIPIAAQDQFIAEANRLTPPNRYDVKTLRSSQSLFISRPRELLQLFV